MVLSHKVSTPFLFWLSERNLARNVMFSRCSWYWFPFLWGSPVTQNSLGFEKSRKEVTFDLMFHSGSAGKSASRPVAFQEKKKHGDTWWLKVEAPPHKCNAENRVFSVLRKTVCWCGCKLSNRSQTWFHLFTQFILVCNQVSSEPPIWLEWKSTATASLRAFPDKTEDPCVRAGSLI